MNKQTITMLPLLAAATIGMLLVSCKKDGDDSIDDNLVSTIPSPTIKDKNGIAWRLTNSRGKVITYGQDGKLASIGNYTLYGDLFTLVSNQNNTTKRANIYLNKSGLIGKIDVQRNQTSDSYFSNSTSKLLFTYGSDRRLKKITCTGSYENNSSSWNGSFTEELTWQNGKLMYVTINSEWKGIDNGKQLYDKYTGKISFSYGTQVNHTKQFTELMALDVIDEVDGFDELIGALAALGLLGNGPDYLPTGTYEEGEMNEEGRVNRRSYTQTLIIAQNENGMISSEKYDDSDYSVTTYTYSLAE